MANSKPTADKTTGKKGKAKPPEHTLVFLRHGKSAYPDGVPDPQRPLAKRGLRQAALAGDWINKHVGQFDLILCSPATRTRETLSQANLQGPVKYIDDLYHWSHRAYLDVISQYGGDLSKIVVVGHQPAIAATAIALTKNRDSKAARRMEQKYPTSAVAVLESKKPFTDLATGHMKLVNFHVPERPH